MYGKLMCSLFSRIRPMLLFVLAISTAQCFATSISTATSFSGVYNPARNLEELYYIGNDRHINEYDVQTGTTVDLTATRGMAIASGPTLSAVYVPPAGATEIFYIGSVTDLVQIINTNGNYVSHVLNNVGGVTGVPNPWTSVSAAFDTSSNTLEVSYQIQTDDSVTQYGPRGDVAQISFNLSTNSWSGQNLYNSIGRDAEHIETQVNTYFNATFGQMQTGFDPQGEGHIHIASYIPGSSADKSEDLMDSTSGTSMNATDGGGGGGATPICQPGGFVPTHNAILNTEELYYFGTDGFSHQLLYNGSWHSLDITKSANAAQPSACGQFAASYNPTFETTEFYYTAPGNASASGIQINVLNGQGQNGWHLAGSFGNSTSFGDPQLNGALTSVYNTTSRQLDLFYLGFEEGNSSAHLFELSHLTNGSYSLLLLN